jgi:NADH-quinone oxidoreductase subunit L
MNNYDFIALVPLLPLASFLLLGLFGKKYFKGSAGIAGTLIMAVATAIALFTAYQYFFVTGNVGVYEKLEPLKIYLASILSRVSIDMGFFLIQPR